MSLIKKIQLPDSSSYSLGVFTGTCITPASTPTKVVSCDTFNVSDLKKGAVIYVTFDNTNTAAVASLKLNVNDTGEKPVKKFYNASLNNLNNPAELSANETYIFQYDGTNWVCMTSDFSVDTKNTVGSSQSDDMLYLVGATTQTTAVTSTTSYSNKNVYTQNGSLYATALYEGNNQVATKSYVDGLVANATVYKGTFNATNGAINGGSTTLTSVAEKVGHLYKCDTAGTYCGTTFEVGDSIYFVKDVASNIAPTATDINPIEGTVSVSLPASTPELSESDTAIATVEGVEIKAKISSDYIKRADLNSSLSALGNTYATQSQLSQYVKETDLPKNYSQLNVYSLSNPLSPTIVKPSSSDSGLTIYGGDNVTLIGSANSQSITIEAIDTTYTAGTNITISDNIISAPNVMSNIKLSANGGNVPANIFDSSISPASGIMSFVAGPDISIGVTGSNQIQFDCTYQGVKGVGISTIQAISADAYNATDFLPDPSTVYIVTAN